MTTVGRAGSARLQRLDGAIGVVLVLGVVATVAMLAAPGFSGHVEAHAVDLVFDTGAFVVTSAVAALTWIRYRERQQPIALVQSVAFLVLAIADGVAVVLGVTGDVPTTADVVGVSAAQLTIWLAARLLAAALLFLGGTETLRGGRPRFPRALVAGVVAFMAIVVGATFILGERVTSLFGTTVFVPPGDVDETLTPLGATLTLLSGVLFVAAAVVGRRIWRRDGVVGDAFLVLGLVVAAFAQLHVALFPSAHPEQVGSSDLLRLGFYVVLFAGIQAEARSIMSNLRAVNETLAVLRDAEVERAALEERARLSRELHDGLAQDLWLAKLKVVRLAGSPGLPDEDRALAEEAVRAVDEGLTEARQSVIALRGDQGDSFADVVGRYLDDAMDRYGLAVTFVSVGEVPELSPRTKAELLRIVQESLSNAARHARPRNVVVRLTAGDGEITVSVEDDGRGFDPSAVAAGHVGLEVMRERAAAIGARLSVESAPGRGTVVGVHVPFVAASPARAKT